MESTGSTWISARSRDRDLRTTLPGLLSEVCWVLDGNGEATGGLDVTALPVAGLRCWVAALVIDKGTIGTVADPIVIKL